MTMNDPIANCIDHNSPWGSHAPSRLAGAMLRLAHAVPERWTLAPRLVKVLRRPVKYGRQPCYDVTVWDHRLRLTPHGNRSEMLLLYAPQLFDAREREFLAIHLKPGGTFVDIGANAGVYTWWASHCLGGRGRIVAFEPDDEMRARLVFNLKANALGHIDVVPVALSDHQGTAVLYINLSQRGQNTVEASQASAAGGDRVTQTVELDTLHDRLQALGVQGIDALKIDIEGHELPVLRHFFGHAQVGMWPRIVLAEYAHDADNSTTDLLHSVGYRTVLQTALNRGYQRDDGAHGTG